MTAHELGEFYKEKIKRLPHNSINRPMYKGTTLKAEIVKAFYKINDGSYDNQRSDFIFGLGISKATIYTWRYNAKKGIRVSNGKSIKLAKSKPLKTLSSAADGSKIMGTTLTTMLNEMENYDTLDKIRMARTLTAAGYDANKIATELRVPSMEDFTKIMKAVQTLSDLGVEAKIKYKKDK